MFVTSHLEANEPFLPGVYAREVDLTQRLVAQLEVDAIGGDSELEGHCLMSFCHCGYYSRGSLGLRTQQENTVRMNQVHSKTCLDVAPLLAYYIL